jgi:alpha-amylase
LKYLKLILLFTSLQFSALNAQNKTYWWNDQVFYEIFVRSFYDSNGNGIGDFKGLMQKLDYLNDGNPATNTDLGVTALWLMPVMESPSYHGYDVVDYKKIEQDYGTNQDFQAFLDSAHARGIKVIIDLVLNHTSNQNPWFQNSKSDTGSAYRNWYVWKNSNPGTGGWYNSNGYYYYGAFGSGMPDLNYFNQDVKNGVNDIVKYWLDTVRVDGFRLDAIKFICEEGTITQNAPSTFAYLREFRNYYKSVNPDAMAVGEAWSSTHDVLPFVDGTGIDFCFEFETASDIINAINYGDPGALALQINDVVTKSYPFLQYGTFLTNHDQVRIFSQLGNNVGKSKLAAGVLLTLPGVPFIYYGEEIGMTSNSDDPSKRTPMQWTPGTNAGFTTGTPWHSIPSAFQMYNVQTMSSDTASLLSSYKKLIRIREKSSSLRRGIYIPLTTIIHGLYAFGRYKPDDNDLTFPVHNFSGGTITAPLITAENSGLPSGAYKLSDMITGKDAGMLFIDAAGKIYSTPNITLESCSSAILKAEILTDVNQNKEKYGFKSFRLYQNYPNPWNPETTINYSIAKEGNVKLTIYNAVGSKVAVIVNEYKPAGSYSVQFNAGNLSSGIYLYRLESGNYSTEKKFILLK